MTASWSSTEFRSPPRRVRYFDLALDVDPHELEQALARAERERLFSQAELSRESSPGRRGCRAVRVLLRNRVSFTRSEAEKRLLELVRKAELPPPETNVRVEGHEVDFFWRRERLVVEVDGFAFHGSRASFEGDRRRDARLAAAGIQVIRVTWSRMERRREALVAALAQALAIRVDASQ